MITLPKTSLLAFLLWPNPTGEIKLSRVGIVDTQRMNEVSTALFKKALEPEMAIIMSFERQLVEFRNQKLKELEAFRQQVAAGTLSEQDFLDIQRNLEAELWRKGASAQEEIGKEQAALKVRQQKAMDAKEACYQAAIEQIASQRNLLLILKKEAVVYGAQDITREVLDSMRQQDCYEGI